MGGEGQLDPVWVKCKVVSRGRKKQLVPEAGGPECHRQAQENAGAPGSHWAERVLGLGKPGLDSWAHQELRTFSEGSSSQTETCTEDWP